MKVYQQHLDSVEGIQQIELPFTAELIFLFVSPDFVAKRVLVDWLSEKYPGVILFGCSTAGEILGNHVYDGGAVLTAVHFEDTRLKIAYVDLSEGKEASKIAGSQLAEKLMKKDLRHLFVLSEGLNINGAGLVEGLQQALPERVSVTGGLAADGEDFERTFLICNQEILENKVAGLAFYGSKLKVGYGSKGGWDSFGMERLVTRSEENILFELDGEPALNLYESFLGDQAQDLPRSGLLFPLSMRINEHEIPVVRTILGINRAEKSLTFAGNITQGSYVRLMKANIDRIIDGAERSADISKTVLNESSQLAILISCVGRRLVLKQLVEEEVEAVGDVLGTEVPLLGFYSYGEIAPFNEFSPCTLHNQTMTITTFSE